MVAPLAQPSYEGDPTEQHVVDQDKLEPLAVVGFAFKFPQDATSPESFWQMLVEGRSAMTEVPKDRWNIDAFYHPDPDRHDSMNARGGHFLKANIADFDAPFFSLPPAEAVCMDPQQRSLLETTYHALENAGIPMADAIGSRTCVHVGSFAREYETMVSRDPQMQAKYLATGTGTAMLANRISWFYDLRGPSISLDTACSGSLNALHLSAQSLRSGESDMGIIAGCNLILNPETNSIPLSNLSFLSPDSKCYSFDHRANGYSRGEGTAVVVIKRLSDAIKDNDVIRAVIRATGANQDGKTPGITQPSKEAQVAMIRETYAAGGLDLQETGFFEAHGTGTPVGDPREVGAIGAVFKDSRKVPLVVGAVKSNIGHLEGASGLAGLIKTILILEKGLIPRNIWFEKPNPAILVEEWNIKFPTDTIPWPTDGLRRASVNSFGYGGANAHVVLDDAYHYLKLRKLVGKHCSVPSPPRPTAEPPVPNGMHVTLSNGLPAVLRPRLFVWSASDEGGLGRLAKSYGEHAQHTRSRVHGDKYLDDLAYTLSNRRSILPWKSFFVGQSVEDIQEGLSAGRLSKPIRSSSSLPPALGFLFTGQGAQWYAMGRELLVYPVFRNSLRSAQKYLQLLGCKWLLLDELARSEELSNVNSPAYAQPMCTALQIALVELFSAWKIFPTAVAGHSSGEIAAAYCAGGVSRESAWKIAYHRGALASRLAEAKQRNGSMMAVALSEADIQPYLTRIADQFGQARLSVGCINSPKNLTITGDEECVDALKALMDQEGIFARKLRVTVAYHSSHMKDIAFEYQSLIQDIIPRDSRAVEESVPALFSSVTGKHIAAEELGKADYWVANLVSPVRFSDALDQLCSSLLSKSSNQAEAAQICLIEVGPHAALQRPVKETLGADPGFKGIIYDTALVQNASAVQSTLGLMGRLHCSGCTIDLLAINSPDLRELELQALTDLPEYAFNHSQSYWLESRISRNFRFRELPRHELLGVRTNDWNPLEAKWTNIIRASENPWIKDHTFNGSELYPAAGMIVMAVEAARQMANPHLKIKGYRLEGISFFRPLLVSLAPEGVETQFHLRPHKGSSKSTSPRNTFHLYLCSADKWTEICNGTILTEYQTDKVDEDQDSQYSSEDLRTSFENGVSACKRFLDSKDLYENLATFGSAFGPTFQSLKQVYFSDDKKATATVNPREWAAKVPHSDRIQDHVIHPTALDALMHLTVVALSRGTWETVRTMVPTRIQKLWISNDLLAHTKGQELKAYTHSTFLGYRDVEFSVCAFDTVENECQILFEGYRGTAISSLDSSDTDDSGRKRICFDVDWKPDPDLLTSEQTASYCNAIVKPSDLLRPESIDASELICLYFMSIALETIASENFISSTEHINKYVEWMKDQCARYEAASSLPNAAEGRPSLQDRAHFEEILDHLEDTERKELLVMVGRQLMQILRGEVDTLDLLFNGSLVQSFYAGGTFTPSYRKAAHFIDLLAHKDPTLKILEIGAGTGGTTAPILEKLARNGREDKGVQRYSQYVYTDISPRFFESARERFSEHADRMVYRVLDIEKDPIQQGFDAGRYDVVIASSVLHATSNIDNTLNNARRLLKPGGSLVLLEPCNLEAVLVPFIFGLLPGWWLSTEKYRYWGPLLKDEDWHHALTRNGFSAAEICLRDFQDHRHTMSVMISRVPESVTVPRPGPQVLLVTADQPAPESELVRQVESQIQSLGVSACETIPFKDILSKDLKETVCIFLLELDKPLLYGIGEEDFARLKMMIHSASGVLWLTRGRESRPEVGLITGLGRTLLSEIPDLVFVELAVEQESSIAGVSQHITKVFQTAFCTTASIGQTGTEYMEKDGLLHINRVVEANYLNDRLHSRLTPQKPVMQKLLESPERTLALTIHTPGLLDTLQFEEDESAERRLEADQVEIEVKAIGVSFKDVTVALGQIPANALGLECSGIISRVGHGISEARLKPGDRVCCIAIGAYKTRVRTYAAAVTKIPDDMSFNTASAIPLVFCTAYYALVRVARIREGESVLIHSGAGGMGQAAIQLAKTLRVEIYVTVGNKDKKKLLKELYQIPEDHIFISKDASFVPKLKRMTSGVDVVLNSLSGEGLRKSLDCVAPFGRFVDISKTDFRNPEKLPMSPLSQNVTYASVDLALIFEKSKVLMGELMSTVMKLVVDDQVRAPQPLHVYKSSELEGAFRFLQGGKNTGKTVVEMREDDMVPVVPSTRPTYYFDEKASYVIAGGLGGLGRSIARWMVDRGAKNLILLGRSGARDPAALEFVEEMMGKGITIAAPPCDVSDEEALRLTLDTCSRTMPPIKGCIQGSMVLRDGLFEGMSLEDYNAVTKPKAQGSWNLHVQLPRDMDFFILLSSVGGVVGTRGQSNYASANTYQDALARHRVSRGQKGIALDLGLVLSVGFAAENKGLVGSIKQLGYEGIREVEIHEILDYLCDPSLQLSSPLESQIVTGLAIPKLTKTKVTADRADWAHWARRPLFRNLAQMDGLEASTAQGPEASVDYEALFRAAGSPGAAAVHVLQGLKTKLSKTLWMPEEDIDAQKPIHSYGVDSLVAVEVRYWLAKEMKAHVSIFEIMGDHKLAELSLLIAGKSGFLS